MTYKNTSFNSYSGDIVIPEFVIYNEKTYSVTSIRSKAFFQCSSLTSVAIPNSVTYIGKEAFKYCSSLTSVTIPNSITSIEYGVFDGCSSLASVTIPNSVKSIGDYAFQSCHGLTSVTIPNSVTSIGSLAFNACDGLTSIAIGNSVTSIGAGAFSNCVVLTSVTIPNSVKSIGYQAFRRCTGLTSITIPSSVTSIESGTFDECSGLKKIIVPDIAAWCDITFYHFSSNPLYYARGHLYSDETTEITDLVIPNSVTSIGNYAFYNCDGLTSVTIPNSVTSIGNSAFHGCNGLKKVIVPDIAAWCGIKFADYSANPLSNARHLYSDETTEITNLIIPNSVTSIGDYAFYGCYGLTSVTIGNSVTSIGSYAFQSCHGLTSVTIGNSVTSIGSYAFQSCSGLKKVIVPNIAAWCGIEFGNGYSNPLNYAGGHLYSDETTEITDLIIPNSVKSIGKYTFYHCSALTSVTIPNSVTNIGESAFYGCTGLKKVIVPDIAAWCGIAFDNNSYSNPLNYAKHLYSDETTEITNLIIPNSVTSIGDYAFYYCNGLTSVTIPNSVTSIGNQAFYGCTKLIDVHCYAESVPSTDSDAFMYSPTKNATLHVPYGCKAAYEAVSPWNEFGTIVEMEPESPIISFADAKVKALCVANWDTNSDGELDEAEAAAVTDLGTVFKGNTEITSFNELQYFTGLTAIGKDAFWGCSWLTSIVIPNSIKIIGSGAFGACNLTQFTIPNGVTTIGNSAFYGCYKIPSIVIPSSVTSIGELAFWVCYDMSVKVEEGNTVFDSRDDCNAIIETATNTLAFGFNKTVIPNSVTRIGNKAFFYCTRSNPISIPNSVTSIGDMAFAGCHNMTSIVIPNSVSNIGKGILGWCDKLTSVKVEEGNTIYDSRKDCNAIIETETNTVVAGVKNTIIPNDVTCIGDSAFCNCTELTAIDIPNSVNCIGKYAFENCWSMSSISIGENVKTIGASAFEDCRALTSIDIPNSVTDIGEWALGGCDSLKFVKIGNSVENIGEHAFAGCESLTSVDIPNSVTDIGEDAFSGCDSLKFVKIGNSVENIGESAFRGCESLTKVHVTDLGTWCNIDFEDQYANPLYYAGHLYMNDREITNLVIPNSVKNISNYAFFNCESLSSVVIPNSVSSIGYAAFDGCSNLASATIGSGVDSIDHYAFDNCPELTNVYCFAEKVPTTYTWAEAFNKTHIKNATLHVPYGCKAAYEAASPWNGFGEIVEMTSPITVGGTGFATFCSPYALDFSEVEDIRAYIVSGFNQETGTLVLTRVTEVPAGEGLYIAGMPGEHQIPQTQTSMFYANLLKGVTEPTIISPTDGNYTNYILSNGSYGVGFYTLSQTGTLDAGKAYLQLPTASVAGIKALKIEFDENDDPTGIAITSTSPTEENTIYNLAGQRVNKAQKGINIVNGKKVFIK